jgi:hypothetical protein
MRFVDTYSKDERRREIVDGWKLLQDDVDSVIDWKPQCLEQVCNSVIRCMAPFPKDRLSTNDLIDELRMFITDPPQASSTEDCTNWHLNLMDIDCSEGQQVATKTRFVMEADANYRASLMGAHANLSRTRICKMTLPIL